MQAAEKLKLDLTYQGSVKRVFSSANHPDFLWFDFSDDYSVFDWGKMPDTIENKGRALVAMGAHFLQVLAVPGTWAAVRDSRHLKHIDAAWLRDLFDKAASKKVTSQGMNTHLVKVCDESGADLALEQIADSARKPILQVIKADVFHPTMAQILGQTIYHYPTIPASSKTRLVPLEVVFRFGMPAGSSLKERLAANPDYAKSLGLTRTPVENEFFDRPVIEFYTKLEPKDRLLNLSEALNMSTLTAAQFEDLADRALLAALALAHLFGEAGIELWDGKFEFIIHDGDILLADSIGPDELRLLYRGHQLSKEMIRQAYRGSPWEKSLKQAQQLASERGTDDWKAICRDELKQSPQPLSGDFKKNINKLYGVLANHLSGKKIFSDHPTLEGFADQLTGGAK